MQKYKILLSFLFVSLVAAIFRITNLDLIEFKGDEAINLYLAARPVFGHSLPPGGTISSIGIVNPPLLNYILFPFALISTNPKIVSLLIGLLNSVTIGLLYLVYRHYYGFKSALISCIFIALSPWAIIYSRKVWAQDFILPLMVPLILSVHKIVKEKKPRYWILYAFISLLLIQLHQPSLYFVAIVSLLIIVQQRKVSIKYSAIGIVLGLLPLIPYLIFQLGNSCPACASYTAASQRFSENYDLILFFRPLQIMSQGGFRFILGEDVLTMANSYPLLFSLRRIFYFEYLLIPLGGFLFLKQFPKLKILVWICILLPAIYFVSKVVPHMHYFVTLIPFLALLLGTAFAWLIKNKHLAIKYSSIVVLVLLISISIWYNLVFFDLLRNKQEIKGDYGTIFAVTEKRTNQIYDKYKDLPEYEEILLNSYVPKDFYKTFNPPQSL
ncbi:hypothetical protein GW940_00205 [Candidatus Microgenomates bacterium]|nr:hypothetical protein [Candidatus Microgenomates bacterium]